MNNKKASREKKKSTFSLPRRMEHPFSSSRWSFCNLLQWILLLWIASVLESATVLATEPDRLALLELKTHISHDPHQVMALWNDSVHFCSWFGVICNLSNARVLILNLEAQGLSGTIPPSIGNLTFLSGINLRNNSLSGEVPQEIGRLQRLHHLNLSGNFFSGKIPTNLTYLTELRVLDFARNRLIGQIPEQLSSLSKLELLRFASNNLTGKIPPWIGNISSLRSIWLSVNNFEGSIPEAFGRLPKLGFLQINGNRLSGTVPSSIYNMSSLYFVTFAQNNLHGQIPPDIGLTLPNLRVFACGVNNFAGQIPASLSNASGLGLFDVANNSLTGPVPVGIASLTGLYWLNLDSNMLSSGKPRDLTLIDFLANCTVLEVLGLAYNQFAGKLPGSAANLSTQLRIFTLGGNLIHGTIPVGIGNLLNLSLLGLESNFLTGCVPATLSKLYNLPGLFLNGNRLSGLIPSALGNLTSLTMLSLDDNRFEGTIPPSIGNCSTLLALNLSFNNLSGAIPRQILSLPSLSVSLSISHNSLTGSLPREVGNLHNLGALDFSENRLSGQLPSTLGSCIHLQHLFLQGNSFEGIIPSSMSLLTGLEEVDLSRNNLSGQIPEFFSKISTLRLLNLSYNDFEGQVSFNKTSVVSVIGNTKLCGGLPELHLPPCSIKHTARSSRKHLAIILSTVLVLFAIVSSSLLIYIKVKRSRRISKPVFSEEGKLPAMSYSELFRATDGFSLANLIGSGGCGSVYKGIISGEGKTIAVKVLNLENHRALESFNDECQALRSVRHRNLVKIVTACSGIDHQGNDFKALVFEFMPNGNLDEWLHPRAGTEEPHIRKFGFLQRLDIAIDVASALDYLHHQCETPLVHCDVKPSNILLDEIMTAHVSDFGLARFLFDASRDDPSRLKPLSSVLKGSIGYIPPEYGTGGQISMQGDIYSYGVLLLEMFTGKRPTDATFNEDLSIHQFVTIALPDRVTDIVDPSMFLEDEKREIIEECAVSVMRIGLLCSAVSPNERMAMNVAVGKLQAVRKLFQSVCNPNQRHTKM